MRKEIHTSLGTIPLEGDFDAGLKVLAIKGMLAPADDMERLPRKVAPRYGGIVASLPGHGGPDLSETSIAAFATAFDEVVAVLGPTIVVGMSIGALVALAMRAPDIRSVVAVEPPLETVKLWPMINTLKVTFEEHATFHENIFGFDGAALYGRDYLHLLDDLHRPTDFVVGDLPLFPVRHPPKLPSTVDNAHRRMIRALPKATLHVAPRSGHGIQHQAGPFLLDVILAACARGDPMGEPATGPLGATGFPP